MERAKRATREPPRAQRAPSNLPAVTTLFLKQRHPPGTDRRSLRSVRTRVAPPRGRTYRSEVDNTYELTNSLCAVGSPPREDSSATTRDHRWSAGRHFRRFRSAQQEPGSTYLCDRLHRCSSPVGDAAVHPGSSSRRRLSSGRGSLVLDSADQRLSLCRPSRRPLGPAARARAQPTSARLGSLHSQLML